MSLGHRKFWARLLPTCIFAAVLAVICVATSLGQTPAAGLPSEAGAAIPSFPTSQMSASAQAEPGWGDMTSERREQAVKYSATKNTFYFVQFAYDAIVLIVLLLTGFSSHLLKWAKLFATRRFLVLFIYLAELLIVLAITSLPFDYFLGYHLEHQYGLSNQTVGGWLLDSAKSQAVTFVLMLIVVGILYRLIRRYPHSWWAWFGAGAAPFAVFFIVIAPLVITPLFYHTTPLDDSPLKTQILRLAQDSGISDSRIFVIDASRDTKKLNAYVTGLGQTKRVVLFDNLLAGMTPPEILFVVGHEMGHYLLHHVWIGLFIVVVFIFLIGYLSHLIMSRIIAAYQSRLGFDRLSSLASLPLIMLCFLVFGFLMSPVQNGLSRQFEHRADVFGLEKTRDGMSAARAFEKLASVNLSNPDPSPFIKFWLYDHPALSERVSFARAYGSGASVSGTGGDSLRFAGERHLANIKQLTFGGENAEAYFDGEGKRLSFQSTRDGYNCDRIFIMGIDGSDVRQISAPGGVTTCAFIQPDGKRLIYSSTYLVDDSCPPKPSFDKGYVWALHKGYDIYSAKPDGTDLRRLTDSPGYDAEGVYSTDGSKILFTSARDGDLELYTMNPDGSNQTRLTHDVGYDGGAFFSADGQRIVYRAHHPTTPEAIADYKELLADGLIRPTTLEIFVMDADGKNQKQVTSNGAANFCPYFHPNGKQIIFVSNMDDPKRRNFEIYLINVDGTGLERITYNETFDGFPMFNRDGTKLVFASNRHNAKSGETNIFIADWIE